MMNRESGGAAIANMRTGSVMNSTNLIPPFGNGCPGGAVAKSEPDLSNPAMQRKDPHLTRAAPLAVSNSLRRQESEEHTRLRVLGTTQESRTNDSIHSSASPIPSSRQFWKTGNDDEWLPSKSILQNATGSMHVHPKFLHSNATSHKWVFGAVAELLDNAVDEIQRGATFVSIDKMSNPRDGNPVLLIQDDGGGMDPDGMRCCLSFGFSNEKSESTIGRYGNGFKTSTMRLGADSIVFTRSMKERKRTQSVGLLSYTYLKKSGHDRIVVPMVDYELDELSGTWKTLQLEQNFASNMSILLRWSPYSTESELLNQFEAVGCHGTRIIIYNLWCNNDDQLELDFDSDPEDILMSGDQQERKKTGSQLINQYLDNRLRYSLRAYLSILYLRIPNHFHMLLRGRAIEIHNIADDLKYPEFILYKPHSANIEVSVVTTIGLLKDAPSVNIHGFNVYHKNRLILPFWRIYNVNNKGRGIVGILEANFIQPTHNKQDFERTPIFQKLEHRLQEMTLEYWKRYHEVIKKKPLVEPVASCNELLGTDKPDASKGSSSGVPKASSATEIQQNKVRVPSNNPSGSEILSNFPSTSYGNPSGSEILSNFPSTSYGAPNKRREHDVMSDPENRKRKVGFTSGESVVPRSQPELATKAVSLRDQMLANLLQEREKGKQKAISASYEPVLGSQSEPATIADPLTDHLLQEREKLQTCQLIQEREKLQTCCLEFETKQEDLRNKLNNLMLELNNAKSEYSHLLKELNMLNKVKIEKDEDL